MVFRPHQPNMEYDFDLRRPNCEVAAVEVTSSRDQIRTHTSARIFDKKRGGSHINAVLCKKSWRIYTSCNEIRRIREGADKYLAQLEAEGIERFDSHRMHVSPKCVQDICIDLNLTDGQALSSELPPEITITYVGATRPDGASSAIEAGEKEAEANKEKLGKAGTKERHLVVYIDHLNRSPYVGLTEFKPLSVLPSLPDEITHIWLVTEKKDQFVVWYGSKTESWRSNPPRSKEK